MKKIDLRLPSYIRHINNQWSAYILFLIWPFFSLIYAIVNFRSPWAKNIVWLFSGFFGFTFVISNEGMDANSYRSYLQHLYESDITFSEYFVGVYHGIYGRGDYLEPTIRYLISLFSDDYRVLFAVFGLIMGYFYSRNIWFLIDEAKGFIKPFAFPFILMFIFLVPFWLINGFRFWTATHIFVFGVIQIFYFKSYKVGALSVLLSILTHIALLVPSCIAILYLFMPRNGWFFTIILLISILFLRLDLNFLIKLIPDSVINSMFPTLANYLNETYAASRLAQTEDLRWYVRYKSIPIYLYSIFTAIVLLASRFSLAKNKGLTEIYNFGLLMFAISNILDVIPSAGRFYSVAYLLIYGAVFLFIQNEKLNNLFQWFFLSALLFVILPILIQIRIGMDFISPNTLLYNPLFTWLLGNDYALVHFYKG